MPTARTVVLVVAAALLAAWLSGCALVFKGPNDRLNLSSSVPGAEVLVDGVSRGFTPLTLELKADRAYTLVFRKPGFADQKVVVQNRVGALWVVLDVVTGLVPLLVDAATGAWYEFDRDDVYVVLTPAVMNDAPLPEAR